MSFYTLIIQSGLLLLQLIYYLEVCLGGRALAIIEKLEMQKKAQLYKEAVSKVVVANAYLTKNIYMSYHMLAITLSLHQFSTTSQPYKSAKVQSVPAKFLDPFFCSYVSYILLWNLLYTCSPAVLGEQMMLIKKMVKFINFEDLHAFW